MPGSSTDTGAPFVIGYDQGNIGFPIVAIQYDQQVGPGQTRPPLGTPAPAGTACPGAPNFPASYVFVGATTLIAERKMQWVYRMLPGAWSAAKETPDPDGAIVTTITRDNIGSNIIPQDLLSGGVNTITSAEPIDAFLAKEIQTSRPIDGTAFPTKSYSDRGDAITINTQYVNPQETPPARAYGVDVTRQPGTLNQAKQTVVTTPLYGWSESSNIDPETNITGNISKTFVASSPSNTAGQYTGPEVVNGRTFGSSGDLVVVEYQEYENNIDEQLLLVTVFKLLNVEAQSQATPFFGRCRIPPQLLVVQAFQDPASSNSVGSSGANWSDEVTVSWDAEIGLTFGTYPEEMEAVRTRTYSIGTPSLLPTPTEIRPALGNIVVDGGEYHVSQSQWSNDSSSGYSLGTGKSTRYKFRDIPPCLCAISGDITSPGTFNTFGSGTNYGLTSATAGITGFIAASVPRQFNSGDTVTKYATAKMRYDLYALDTEVYTLP